MAQLSTDTDMLNRQCDELDSLGTFLSKLREQLLAMSMDAKITRIKLEKFTELLDSKVIECDQYKDIAKQFNQVVLKIKKDVDETQANLFNESKEWYQIKQKLAMATAGGKVTLNVGGEKYQTSIETLTREKDTFFTALFSRQWGLEKDEEGCVFIDRNGKLFGIILEYLRTGRLLLPNSEDSALRQSLMIEAEFYHLKTLHYLLSGKKEKMMET
ncbi:unnamed protein product [Didymodactylos carnosus]|uniref:BTB domain-containing protein n=1 Tax=Didymodactylos carnosus TaxID=1234261 RepID=A0A8S2CVC5_9BILA|nr:unnamed protein product [Didymodactylos carnosus]CAF3597296.1 unnamed protein product [Didymodactylos carnosus]